MAKEGDAGPPSKNIGVPRLGLGTARRGVEEGESCSRCALEGDVAGSLKAGSLNAGEGDAGTAGSWDSGGGEDGTSGSRCDSEGDTGAARSRKGEGVLLPGDRGVSREKDRAREGESTTLSLLDGRAKGLRGRSDAWPEN